VERLRDLIDAEAFLLDGIVDLLLPGKTTISTTYQQFCVGRQKLLGILPMRQLPAIPIGITPAIGDSRVVKFVELQDILRLHRRQLLVSRRL
jgi:hypothetical protein